MTMTAIEQYFTVTVSLFVCCACHLYLSNALGILNDIKVHINIILHPLTTTFLLNVVVEIVGILQNYDEYGTKLPVNKFDNIQRSNAEAKLGDFKHHVFIYQSYTIQTYRAFCAGSIITDIKVLTSSHCFFTNRKRRRRSFNSIRVVAGILYTVASEATADDNQQWRSVLHIYTQRFFRFPSFNLAVLEVKTPWIFNKYVNKIPYTQKNQDFDGVCVGTAVKTTKSWSVNKSLVSQGMKLITQLGCEKKLRRNCYYYYCSMHIYKKGLTSTEIEGGGLVCHGTGDPAEDESGVLVGVTAFLTTRLPTLHNRIGLFHKWVTDGCDNISWVISLKFPFVIILFYYVDL